MSPVEELLRQARQAAARVADQERELERVKADYFDAIRRVHVAGGSLREIAAALELSHQRIHQIVDGSSGGRSWRRREGRVTTPGLCSFCGRDRSDVGKLIAGPGVHICNLCVPLAQAVHLERAPRNSARTRLELITAARGVRCSFCRSRRLQARQLVAGVAGWICAACLALCGEILNEEMVENQT